MTPVPRPSPPVVISGTGAYAPARIVTNDELSSRIDTTDAWIRERTGIRERRLAGPDEAASDLAVAAGRAALADAGLSPDAIGVVIVATMTPDSAAPATACLVQHRLGIPRAAAFDVQAACSGFLYAMEIGAGLLRSGLARHALVIGAEKLSGILDWTDRTTCVLFGDGAGAVVLSVDEQATGGLDGSLLFANGGAADLLHVPAGGSREPLTAELLASGRHFLRMRGKEVFKVAVRSMEDAATELLASRGLSAGDIDLVVPHQANLRIIDALSDYLGVPRERFYINLERFGNTSAASIPIALDEAARRGLLRPGHRILMAAFGAGLTWGASLLTWTKPVAAVDGH